MSELRWILLGCGVVLLLGIFFWGRGRGQAAQVDALDEVSGHGRVDPPMTPTMAAVAPGERTQPVATRWQENQWASTVTDLPEIRLDALQAFDDPMPASPEDEELLLPAEDGFIATSIQERQFSRHSLPEREPSATTAEASEPESLRDSPRSAPKAADKRKIIALRLSAVLPDRFAGSQLRAALEAQGLTHGKYGIFHRKHSTGASILSAASMVEPGAFDLATMSDTGFAGVTIFTLLPGPLPAAVLCEQLLNCARQLEATLGGALHDERGQLLNQQRADDIRNDALDFEHLLGATHAGPVA